MRALIRSPPPRESTPEKETRPAVLLTHRRIEDRDGRIVHPDAKGYSLGASHR